MHHSVLFKSSLLALSLWGSASLVADEISSLSAGFIYDAFPLTLQEGKRKEIAGPLYFHQESEGTTTWGFPPFYTYQEDPEADLSNFDILYPLLTYDRFGTQYRIQLFQLLSFAGGESLNEQHRHRFTLFPLYFKQWSTDPKENYQAFVPFYGHLRNRLMRDDIRFAMFPIWSRTQKKDVVTDNYLYPIFHWRRGDGLKGGQVWPLFGLEKKVPTTITNSFDEPVMVGGHRKMFVGWPFFHDGLAGIGTTNPVRSQLFFPLYSRMHTPTRDSVTTPWPIGFTYTDDRALKYREYGFPWPFWLIARGEGKHTTRFWPLFSQASNATLRSSFYLWPVYKENQVITPLFERRRTRILFFLYSDVRERNMAAKTTLRRHDFWPLFIHRKGHDGKERLQILAPLEPFLPTNGSIERNWSPLWSLWRQESDANKGRGSQSLLWNLYRRDVQPEGKNVSVFFGLLQYETHTDKPGRKWRIGFFPRRRAESISANP